MRGVIFIGYAIETLRAGMFTIPSKRVDSKIGNLVLRAMSEIIGSAPRNKKALNPKHEIRNPKQYRMSKIQIIQTIVVSGIAITDLFLSLEHLIL